MSFKRNMMILSAAALLSGAVPALARVEVGIDIGIPPPSPQVEVIPAAEPGMVWAPGYWAWQGGSHVWIAGHYMAARPGYGWVADHWEVRGERHHFEPGHWERR
jgi:hypothetical protein